MDTKTTLPVLETSPIFAVLTAEERLILQHSATMQTYGKHQVIYKPGQQSSKVFFLLKGIVKIAIHAEKKDIIKYVVRGGCLFGESYLTGDTLRRDFAYAMDDQVEVLELDSNAVVNAMKGNFAFAQSLLHFLGDRLRYTETQLEKVVLKDSKSRIMEFLHQMPRTGPAHRLRNPGKTQYDAPGYCRSDRHQPPDGHCSAQSTKTL